MTKAKAHKSIVFNIFGAFLADVRSRYSSLNMNKLFAWLLILSGMQLSAQGGINSPFSRFGIGDLNSESPMHVRQMGGLGASYIDLFQLNFDNPATLSHLQSAAFDIGLDMKRSSISDKDNSSTQWSGNLGYLALGFPLRNPYNAIFSQEDYKFNWGMGFAIMPNSSVSYDISRSDETTGGQEFVRNFTGTGGSYKAIWGNAIKYGDFSLGANIGWLFGKLNYERNINFTSELSAFNNRFSNSYTMRGFYSKFGFMYVGVLNKKEVHDKTVRAAPKSVSVGLTYKPSLSFNTKAQVADLNVANVLSFGELSDTLNFATDQLGSGALPAELAFGVNYNHGIKYSVGFDVRTTYWSKYRNDANPEVLDNTTRIGFGGQFRPNPTSLNSIFARSSYRLGFYIEEDPRTLNNEKIKSYGMTLGLGLPLAWQQKLSNLNIGVDIGNRSIGDLLNENFAKITFGFTFNERNWFQKRYLN